MPNQVKKTEQSSSELQLKRSFEPLLSPKDSKARLTFVGYQHTILEWKKDGKEITKPILKLVFAVLDKTHENPANIAITCDYRYNPSNRLGIILNLMGFEAVETIQIIDEDDEFGTKLITFDFHVLFEFLRKSVGLSYKALLKTVVRADKFTGEKKEAKGLWEIDFTTIEPLISKGGEQKRDTDADKIGNDVDVPKIDYDMDAD